jgi:hypothetical protein
MQPSTTPLTSNAISLQRRRTEAFAPRRWKPGVRQLQSSEHRRDTGILCSSIANVTRPFPVMVLGACLGDVSVLEVAESGLIHVRLAALCGLKLDIT